MKHEHGLLPISDAPRDKPILAHFPDRDPIRQFCVMYWDDETELWRTGYGRDFIGHPHWFREL